MSDTTSYRFDRFRIDPRAASLRRDDTPVPLRPKSFDVLLYLVRNRGRLISKDELFEAVWADVIVTDNSLVQCIKEIRQALGDAGQTMVETVAKRGYVFTPTVTEEDAPAAEIPVEPVLASSPPAPIRARFGGWATLAAAGVAGVFLIAGGVRWWATSPESTPQQLSDAPSTGARAESRLSIAVLPFGMLGEAADDYFSTGISEDIASALGRFPDLAVASPKVVSRFKSVGASAEDIQRQLRVRYVVEGSVVRSAERIRIAVRLTDLPRGVLLWSQSYDASPHSIFAIQDDIIVRIAGALSVRLSKLEQTRAANTPPSSMEAYDFVLRGRELLTRLNRTSYSEARTMFERAIASDARSAAAYVGLGRIDLSAVALGWTGDAEAALSRAEELAQKALSLDETNPAAHVLLGRTYARMGEYERAISVLKRAIALNPSEPDSYAGLGDALLWSGDVSEAIKALEIGTSIDPRLSAEDLFSLGAAYFLAGRTADATRILERITNRKEGNPFIYALLAASYAESGRPADAQAAAAEVRKLNPFFDIDRFGSLFGNAAHRERLASALKKAGF
jgi:TolB-like protein/DNA-binding winged helix-turn-helix (wHTH) protein/cytochrome c-type biogenesis protein CcmH/NrfG